MEAYFFLTRFLILQIIYVKWEQERRFKLLGEIKITEHLVPIKTIIHKKKVYKVYTNILHK